MKKKKFNIEEVNRIDESVNRFVSGYRKGMFDMGCMIATKIMAKGEKTNGRILYDVELIKFIGEIMNTQLPHPLSNESINPEIFRLMKIWSRTFKNVKKEVKKSHGK